MIESTIILDHILAEYDPVRHLLCHAGSERRRDLYQVALCLTACDKCIIAADELLLRPAEKRHAPYLYARIEQSRAALVALEASIASSNLSLSVSNLANITAAVTIDLVEGAFCEITLGQTLPHLRDMSAILEDTAAFTAHRPEARLALSRSHLTQT